MVQYEARAHLGLKHVRPDMMPPQGSNPHNTKGVTIDTLLAYCLYGCFPVVSTGSGHTLLATVTLSHHDYTMKTCQAVANLFALPPRSQQPLCAARPCRADKELLQFSHYIVSQGCW